MMKINKYASIWCLFVGITMICMWVFFWVSGSIPEIETRPLELVMHLVAEITTAILLIIAGINLIQNKKHRYSLFYLASGMLLYTIIMSPGYYMQLNEWPMVIMFFMLVIITVFLTVFMIRKGTDQ